MKASRFYPRGVREAEAAATAALELIFKQRLKSANVVPAVKPTLFRARAGRGLTQYHPLSKLTATVYPTSYAASRREIARSFATTGKARKFQYSVIKYTSSPSDFSSEFLNNRYLDTRVCICHVIQQF